MIESVLGFFGFSKMPFGKDLPQKDIFETKSFKEARAMLRFGVFEEDIILLTGPIGAGKSVVLKSFISELDTNRYTPVYLRGNSLSAGELYRAILSELKVEPPYFSQKAKMLFFKAIPDLNKKPVVIIDDAQDLEDSALKDIKSMVNFDFDSKNLVTFILAGQNELCDKLKYSDFMPTMQRIRIAHKMGKMTLEETCAYIDHRTKICQSPQIIFSDDAKSEIHKRTSGLPRPVNCICYNTIIAAVAKGIKVIESSNLSP